MNAKLLHLVTFVLLIVGGLNWLLVGVLQWDISMFLGGMSSPLARIMYIAVGLSAVYELFAHKKNCYMCMAGRGDTKKDVDMPQTVS